MRVALISPFSLAKAAGNSVTAARICSRLSTVGCIARVFSLEEYSVADLTAAVEGFTPDLIHAFHAFTCGIQAELVAQSLGLPFIITMTGTDIYRTEKYTPHEVQLLRSAAGITVFTGAIKQKLATIVDYEKIGVIPQGVDIMAASSHSGYKDDFVFLLPAGIRPVKQVDFPLPLLAGLAKKHPQIRLHLVGDIIDRTYASEVLAKYESVPVASWLGTVAHSMMPELYANASVVLNCSFSEGGMANSLLEAMKLEIPVLAADIEGNRSLVIDGTNGLLYQDEASFLAKAERLLVDDDLRSALALNGKKYVEENCSATMEAVKYVELYRKVTGG